MSEKTYISGIKTYIMATQKTLPMQMLIADLEAVKGDVKLDSVKDLLSSIQNLIKDKYVPTERGHIMDAKNDETWDDGMEYLSEVYLRNIVNIPIENTPLYFYTEDESKYLGEYIANEDLFVTDDEISGKGNFEYRRWVIKWEYVNPPQ